MRPATVVPLLLAFCATGCRGIAVQNVRHQVHRTRQLLESGELLCRPREFQAVESRLQPIARRLVEAARRVDPATAGRTDLDPYDRFDVYVVHSLGPNAFVVGDDFAVVTSELLLFTESEEEIAAVLAHELGHLRGAHVIESNRRWQWVQVARGGAAITGAMLDYAAYREQQRQGRVYAPQRSFAVELWRLAGAVGALVLLRFEREQELDADRRAVAYLAAAGYPPDAFVRLGERFRARLGEGGGGDHPPWSQRIHSMREALAQLTPRGTADGRLLDGASLTALQRRLAATLVNLDRRGRLALYEVEAYALALRGREVPMALACGGLGAPPDLVWRNFVYDLRRHLAKR